MYDNDERTVDELVDEIFDAGTVRDTETVSTGGAQAGGDEQAACVECGTAFSRPPGSGAKLCPACRRRKVSEGRQKGYAARLERQARRKAAAEDEKAAANDRQIKQKDPAQKAWDALGAVEEEPHPSPKDVEDMTTAELVDALAAGMRREPGDVVLALYQAARDVARTSGIQTRVLIETMYELDCTLAHVGSV